MKWHPIETAPKEGENLLGYDSGEMFVMKWDQADNYGGRKGWVSQHFWADEHGDGFREYYPKYWMPLPPPPEES